MRDFTHDHSALALNTATLGHNMPGAGAGWSAERTIDACAERGICGIVFWRPELQGRASAIGQYARQAGVEVVGLCRSPFLVGPLAPHGRQAVVDDFRRSIDETADLGGKILTIVVGGVEPGTKGVRESLDIVIDRLSAVLDYASERGVKLALEPLHPMYGGTAPACRHCAMPWISATSSIATRWVWRSMSITCGGTLIFRASLSGQGRALWGSICVTGWFPRRIFFWIAG